MWHKGSTENFQQWFHFCAKGAYNSFISVYHRGPSQSESAAAAVAQNQHTHNVIFIGDRYSPLLPHRTHTHIFILSISGWSMYSQCGDQRSDSEAEVQVFQQRGAKNYCKQKVDTSWQYVAICNANVHTAIQSDKKHACILHCEYVFTAQRVSQFIRNMLSKYSSSVNPHSVLNKIHRHN